MAMNPGDDYDRDILDIIPERFDADADSRQARAGHRLRSYLTLGVAVIAVGVIVAVGLHFMGGKSTGGPGVPVIKADERPIKIRPDDRGGMQVPNQDKLVYERMEQGEGDAKVERLLPPPELPQIPSKSSVAPDLQAVKVPATEVLRPAAPVAPGRMAVEPPVRAAPVEPAVRAAAAEPPVPKVEAPARVVTEPVAPVQTPAVINKPVAATAAPTPAAGYAPVQTRAAPEVPAPVAPAAASLKAPAGGDWLIQLGALRSAPDADKEWGRIQRTHHELLSTLKPDVVRVELGEKGTFWRLRAGPLSEQAARQLCNNLKSRNQGCIIARK